MLLHASAESGICQEGLGLKASESSHRFECLLSSPVPSNFEGPSRQVSLAKPEAASRTCSSKMSTRRHARKREALLRLWSRLITLVTPDFFDRKVSSYYILHLISIRPNEFDYVCCIVTLAVGHTSDCHLAIQFILCFSCIQQSWQIPYDAVTMKATASFIWEKLAQDAW